MADCRHYVLRTVRADERTERCLLSAAEPLPFACPEGCVFYEARQIETSGWQIRAKRGENPPGRRH